MKKRLLLVIALAALLALLTAVAESTWTCEYCNKKNGGRFCTSCGRSKDEATDKGAAACFHGKHDYAKATCTEPQTCVRCGVTKGSALGHNWNDGVVTKEATCVSTGNIRYTCTRCNRTRYETLAADTNNHDWDDGVVTKEATCVATGSRKFTCARCNTTKTETIATDSKNHSWDSGSVTKEATCTATGTKKYTCTLCNKTKTEAITRNTNNHNWDDGVITTAATCTKTGVKTYTCTRCKKTKNETIPKDANNHSWDNGVVTKEATCTATGTKKYTCSLCHKTKNETIPKDTNNHNWNSGVVTKEATCAETGIMTYTCTRCLNKKTETIAKNTYKHNWNDGVVTKEATCTITGIKTYTCILCGKTRTSPIPVKGHVWQEATCTTPKTCEVCGATQGKALGHDWIPATVDYPETCINCGLTRGERLTLYEQGEVFVFGHYEQDGVTTNGKEPISWIVLEVKSDGSLVLMSEYALDSKSYNENNTNAVWQTCTLRTWLNGDFYNTAFNENEKAIIQTTTVYEVENAQFDTESDSATQDKVYLLSVMEVNNYFGIYNVNLNRFKKCIPTQYAKDRGADASILNSKYGSGTCWWWLRSTGSNPDFTAIINDGGDLYRPGYKQYRIGVAVRPVICIKPFL